MSYMQICNNPGSNDFNKPLRGKICQLFFNVNVQKTYYFSQQTYYFPDLLTILHCDLYLLLVTIFKKFTYYFRLLY